MKEFALLITGMLVGSVVANLASSNARDQDRPEADGSSNDAEDHH